MSRTSQIKSRLHGLLAVLLAVAVAFAMVGSASAVYAETTDANGNTIFEESDESALIEENIQNTEYWLTDVNGNKVSTLAQNGKAKVIFFFNTGCKRCKGVENNFLKLYGINKDDVDFIMAEASNPGSDGSKISAAEVKAFFDTLGIDCTSQCYDARDICWQYLEKFGWKDTAESGDRDRLKKPVIVYISADNVIKGYSWNYTNIYKNAHQCGIMLEADAHHWEDIYTTNEDNGVIKSYQRCAACRIERNRTIELPKTIQTQFTYDGKQHCVLEDIDGYTVIGGKETAVGEYKAVVYLDDPDGCTWSDGTTSYKVIKWSIKKPDTLAVVNGANGTIYAGDTISLTANKDVKWSVIGKNLNIKIVSKTSSTATIKCNKAGTAYVQAKAGKETKKVKVVVRSKVPTSISLQSTTYLLGVGRQCNVSVKSVTPTYASKDVIYSSSNKKIATVDSNGIVTGVKTGTVTITATSKYNKRVKARIKMTIFIDENTDPNECGCD